MVFNLVGIEEVDYVSKKTQERVEGVKLHVVGENNASTRVKGCSVETFWVSKRADIYKATLTLPLNSRVNCSFNRWGNLDAVDLMKD